MKDWHAKLGGDTTAESIIDRIVNNTSKIKLQGINMENVSANMLKILPVLLHYIGSIIWLLCWYHCVITPVLSDSNIQIYLALMIRKLNSCLDPVAPLRLISNSQ